MAEKTDPRILRTRKLIMDAFMTLSEKKKFKDITIKDITQEATVNRATFYYHFTDKYDLLDKVLKEDLMINVCQEIGDHEVINEETIKSVFLTVTKFNASMSTRCPDSFAAFTDRIETLIKEDMQQLFLTILSKQFPDKHEHSLRVAAVMLSWAIYGATEDWKKNCELPAEDYVDYVVPYIMKGTDSLIAESI
ncbi:TetR family transcriptional regulator [Thalassobacillus devorans]|uniref:TetR family transcriptional regulator n=1 Tax=Thalassobacillus devorans TaxID=279813 RepID=A0ABQ1NJ76_9BACI|nr:TetR/AcrR family transcriptional regulator [Thalassobacillus devorans]NIK27545.1 AcrR family transcriptional regulator [Thalassobacillus devorans]GGC78599.1 TetR family transcriptional regulator [Thalassobacillus devorans]